MYKVIKFVSLSLYIYMYINARSSIILEQMFRFLFYFIFFFGGGRKIFFSGSTIIKSLAIRQFKVCLSLCLNICLCCKSCKNLSIVTKIGYFFHGSNLSLYTKNCERMFDIFYRAASKS